MAFHVSFHGFSMPVTCHMLAHCQSLRNRGGAGTQCWMVKRKTLNRFKGGPLFYLHHVPGLLRCFKGKFTVRIRDIVTEPEFMKSRNQVPKAKRNAGSYCPSDYGGFSSGCLPSSLILQKAGGVIRKRKWPIALEAVEASW